METATMQYGGAALGPEMPWQVPVFFSVFVLLIFLGVALNKRKKQAFDGLASFLGGAVSGNVFLGNYSFRGVYKNRPLKIKYDPGGKNSPNWLTLAFEDPLFALDLKLSEEDFLKETLEKLGIMKDLDSGDPVFDARFHAASGTADLAVKYLANPEVRVCVARLFDAGAYSLELIRRGATVPGLIKLKKRNPELEADLSMQNLLPMLDGLDLLCSEKNGGEFFGKLEGWSKLLSK
jgi:hypothetical protein